MRASQRQHIDHLVHLIREYMKENAMSAAALADHLGGGGISEKYIKNLISRRYAVSPSVVQLLCSYLAFDWDEVRLACGRRDHLRSKLTKEQKHQISTYFKKKAGTRWSP